MSGAVAAPVPCRYHGQHSDMTATIKMGSPKSPATALLNDLLTQAVTPRLKQGGFRKNGANYHRRHGTTVQAVNIQSSHGSAWNEKLFYVNVAIAFDGICKLKRIAIVETPKEYE